jgi:uncharacterized protein
MTVQEKNDAGPVTDRVGVRRPGLVTTPLSEPFWKAADDGQLLLQFCGECGHRQHYPRNICTHCWSEDLTWTRAAGTGVVWAFTVVGIPGHPAWVDDTPYAIALVELDEGPRVMTGIVDCAPADVQVGLPVVLQPTWDDQLDQNLLTFAPATRA